MTEVFTVGLTGSTGAGKSEVARLMAEHPSWAVLDADQLSREAVTTGSPTLAALVERFSDDILLEDGSLNRKRLAEKAFATQEDTAALNAIVHPAVIRAIRSGLRAIHTAGKRVAVIDAPLLFQSGLDAICDCTVAVLATPDIRRARICARDGLTVEQANLRMQAQPDDHFYRDKATFLLFNLSDKASLDKATRTLCTQIERMVP